MDAGSSRVSVAVAILDHSETSSCLDSEVSPPPDPEASEEAPVGAQKMLTEPVAKSDAMPESHPGRVSPVPTALCEQNRNADLSLETSQPLQCAEVNTLVPSSYFGADHLLQHSMMDRDENFDEVMPVSCPGAVTPAEFGNIDPSLNTPQTLPPLVEMFGADLLQRLLMDLLKRRVSGDTSLTLSYTDAHANLQMEVHWNGTKVVHIPQDVHHVMEQVMGMTNCHNLVTVERYNSADSGSGISGSLSDGDAGLLCGYLDNVPASPVAEVEDVAEPAACVPEARADIQHDALKKVITDISDHLEVFNSLVNKEGSSPDSLLLSVRQTLQVALDALTKTLVADQREVRSHTPVVTGANEVIRTDLLNGDGGTPASSSSTSAATMSMPDTLPPANKAPSLSHGPVRPPLILPPPPPLNSALKMAKTGPCPTRTMKRLFWTCFHSLSGAQSMWTSAQKDPAPLEPDYSSIEERFCILVPQPGDKGKDAPVRKASKEITFVNPDKNLHLSILLKQSKWTNDEVVAMIQSGNETFVTEGVLQQLVKLLPEGDEIRRLMSFRGDKDKLAVADRFCISLLAIPYYQLRIECMLLREETASLLGMLTPKAELVEKACQSLRESALLARFCKLVLGVGNFMNCGSPMGNAVGFRIGSLLKLVETRDNKSETTLLHQVVEEAERNHPDLLALPDHLESCEQAADVDLEYSQSEASNLLERLKLAAQKISTTSAEDVKEQYEKVIGNGLQSCMALGKKFTEIGKKGSELAKYLCEDELSLAALFEIIKSFRRLFIEALNDNKVRKEQADKEGKRKQLADEGSNRHKADEGKNRKTATLRARWQRLMADIKKGVSLKKIQVQL